MANTCPNCGGKVKKRVEVRDADGKTVQTLNPTGENVSVCEDCFIAVDTSEELPEGTGAETPPPEASPRGEPDPPRPEDTITTEGEDFEPAPTSSPEVPPEVAVADKEEPEDAETKETKE